MTETSEIAEPRNLGMKVILNNGKLEMNSASIPIQWYFDEATIAKNPAKILIVEQNEYEISDCSPLTGKRYGCKVSEGMCFIQFLEPGRHKITVYAFSDNTMFGYLLDKEHERVYTHSIDSECLTDGIIGNPNNYWAITAFAEIEIDVPRELFAEKPKTAVGKTAWWWANLLFEKKLRDECHYRKRVLFSLTIQPIVILLCIPLIMLITSVYLIYVFLGSFLYLFFGFRPEPIQIIKDTLDNARLRCNLLKYQENDGCLYRLWNNRDEKQYMPITGIEMAIFAASLYIFKFLVSNTRASSTALLIASLAFTLFILTFMIVIWIIRGARYANYHIFNHEKKEVKDEKIRRLIKAERELRKIQYQKWLHDALLANGISKPTAYTATERMVQRFYVGYWTLKSKVCKPFAE